MIRVREATDSDAGGIGEIFRATYSDQYTYGEFYDEDALKRLIFGDGTLLYVAEDTETGEILGVGSVLLEVGAYTDLVGEFARLAVEPQARRRGIGKLLLEHRVHEVRDRLHVGYMEARVVHPYTLRIARPLGFAPVGFLPMKWQLGDRREHMALLVTYFQDALELRRNHPRVVPEAVPLAEVALDNVGLVPDAIVDEDAPPYPTSQGYDVEELTAEGYSSLLRIERGRVRNREIFGPLRLQYGFFRLSRQHSTYLIARERGRIVGAIGFTQQEVERTVRVFELISLHDHAVRVLLRELVQRCSSEWDVGYIEIDVSAYAPRMQRTLLELGFVPAAYVPALAFHDVERLDVVKMVRLLVPLDPWIEHVIPPARELAELVITAFAQREVVPRIDEVADRIGLFAELSEEQRRRLAGICGYAVFDEGQTIFAEGDQSEKMYLVLSGEVDITLGTLPRSLGLVRAGECLGEGAVLTGARHSATATGRTPVEAGMVTREALSALVRRRPDIGVVLYRNLARDVGEKLRRAARHHEEH
jgi:GNAT superfamily N-acetyltransferase